MDHFELIRKDQRAHPDRHQWPAHTLKQTFMDIRGLLFGPQLYFSSKADRFPGGFGALFSASLRPAHPHAVSFLHRFPTSRLTEHADFQPDRSGVPVA